MKTVEPLKQGWDEGIKNFEDKIFKQQIFEYLYQLYRLCFLLKRTEKGKKQLKN